MLASHLALKQVHSKHILVVFDFLCSVFTHLHSINTGASARNSSLGIYWTNMIWALTNTPQWLLYEPFHLFLEVQKPLVDSQTDRTPPSTSVSSSSVSNPDPCLCAQGILSHRRTLIIQDQSRGNVVHVLWIKRGNHLSPDSLVAIFWDWQSSERCCGHRKSSIVANVCGLYCVLCICNKVQQKGCCSSRFEFELFRYFWGRAALEEKAKSLEANLSGRSKGPFLSGLVTRAVSCGFFFFFFQYSLRYLKYTNYQINKKSTIWCFENAFLISTHSQQCLGNNRTFWDSISSNFIHISRTVNSEADI